VCCCDDAERRIDALESEFEDLKSAISLLLEGVMLHGTNGRNEIGLTVNNFKGLVQNFSGPDVCVDTGCELVWTQFHYLEKA